MPKGMIFANIVVFILVALTTLIIIFTLPNILSVYKTLTGSSPIVIDVIFKPEYIPLSADHALFTLLSSTDPKTGKQIQELFAYAVAQGKTSFDLSTDGHKTNVNLENTVDGMMEFILPNNKYEIVVKNTNIDIGNKGLAAAGSASRSETSSNQEIYVAKSTTTLTLSNLKKVEVILYIG